MKFSEYKESVVQSDSKYEEIFKIMDLKRQVITELIRARGEQKLSQKDLAEKCGLKQSAIARIEGMEINPRLDTLIKIAYVLGLQLSIMKKGDFLEFKSYKMMIQDLSISNNVYSKKIMYNTSFPKEYIMNYKGFYNEG
jgi:transcriptional regulator with XRE-family HTH domain